MKGSKLYILLGVLIALVLALALASKRGLLGNKQGIKVAIDTVKTKDIVESVSSSGKIFPVQEVKVSPDVSGEIITLAVEEGEQVRKGQLLAIINQSVSAVADNNSIANLLAGGAMPGSVVAPPKPSTPSNKRTNIYAPASGIVNRLNIKQGERVVGTLQMAGTEMMRISDMSKMKVDVEIGENDIQKIAIGDTAIIEVDAYNRKKFKGFVSKIAQSNTSSLQQMAMNSDQVSNYTVSVEIYVATYQDIINANRKFPFRPGMSAQVEILTEHHNGVIAVPIVSVTARDLDSNTTEENSDEEVREYVFVIEGKKVKLREVKTGVQDNSFIEIVSGIKLGEQVISAPYSAISLKLKDGDNIKIVPKKDLFEKVKE